MLSESIHLPKSIKDAENRFIIVLKEQLLKLVKAINGLEKLVNSEYIDKINSSGDNYIRYENGLQICWGNHVTSNPPTARQFPKQFNASPCVTLTHLSTVSTGGYYTKIADVSKSQFTPILTNGSSYIATSYRYIAIGMWK